MSESNFWKDKKVFLTGHTGFKGGWLAAWLTKLGASLYGYSLPPNDDLSLHNAIRLKEMMDAEFGDIRNLQQLSASIKKHNPEIIFHLAAQPLVRQSYVDPVATFSTNVIGTVNLLEAARQTNAIRAVVNITTDKCYENREWHWGYRENEPMGGYDPYSASKGCAELVSSSYIRSFYNNSNIGLATARAGNVIGGGDWAEDRLIPDLVRGFNGGAKTLIRNPDSIRPWQHVLEPLSGYIRLAEELYNFPAKASGAWNFGPFDHDAKTVSWMADLVCREWGAAVEWYHDKNDHPHEAQYLKLDISKANALLNWKPRWSADVAVQKTVHWYRDFYSGVDVMNSTFNQIEEYEAHN